MPEVSQANDYLLSSDQIDTITITTVPEGRGWVMRALFPKRTSEEDKGKVLTWMMEYRSNIKHLHPLWDVSFRSDWDHYSLFIMPEGCDADMKKTARDKANVLFDEIVQPYGR